jgi:hypothetical protein
MMTSDFSLSDKRGAPVTQDVRGTVSLENRSGRQIIALDVDVVRTPADEPVARNDATCLSVLQLLPIEREGELLQAVGATYGLRTEIVDIVQPYESAATSGVAGSGVT